MGTNDRDNIEYLEKLQKMVKEIKVLVSIKEKLRKHYKTENYGWTAEELDAWSCIENEISKMKD